MTDYYIETQTSRKRGVAPLYVVKNASHKRVASFPTEALAQGYIDRQDQPATAAPTVTAPTTGWSNASRRRSSHDLGTALEHGDGYTIYEDGFTGHGGRVQIWDKS